MPLGSQKEKGQGQGPNPRQVLHLQAESSIRKQLSWQAKKLVAILVTSMSITIKKEELEQVPYIRYPVTFKDQTEALLDSESKVNVMSQAFAYQLGFTIWKTNVGAQKINGTILETYEMIISIFSVLDKDGRERFFEENFLLANVKLKIVLKMLFLTMSNAKVDFQARDL